MAILLGVQNEVDATEKGHAIALALREELGALIKKLYPVGGLEEAAPELGLSYNTLRRAVNLNAKDATKTVTLDFVLGVYLQLRNKFPTKVDPFEKFYAHATREIV